MNVPRSFRPENKDLEKKTEDLIEGPTIYKDNEDLGWRTEELLRKKEYSYITYEDVTLSELTNPPYHLDQKHWMLSCTFEYKGREFHVKHVNKTSKKEHIIMLESSDGETLRNFKKVLKEILKYNKKERSNKIKGDSEITLKTTPFPSNSSHFEMYEAELKMEASYNFKAAFETDFQIFYRSKFENAKIKYVVLQNITEEQLQKTPYPKKKITNKIEKYFL